ncbi:MAG TPA: ferrous iron transport protein B, partial [Firmicutes bacterium]|nr:ferrous iron transport protein B [Bacillota bacterium]
YENVVKTALQESSRLEKEFGFDIETEIIEKRYGFIQGIIQQCVKKLTTIEEKLTVSDKIDKIVTNRWLGIPIFAFMMWLTFQLTFTIGGFFADYIDTFFGWLAESSSTWLLSSGAPNWLASLVGDGIISGVGAVLVFLPNIMIMFLFLSFLEDVGYMARAAFIMDKAMHAIGLPGKSFIPMILGFGCNVPAIMSTRTISDERDRLLTILINPFISCSARLPVYILFTEVFFKKNQGLIVFSLYALGILIAILSAKLFKSTIPKLKGPVSPLVMELPPYRLPSLKVVSIHTWERSREFLKKAGTIIFAGVILIWLLASIPQSAEYASEATLIGRLGKFFAPLLKPAGFPFWQAAVALLFGIIAKEVVVGTFGTLFGGEENLSIALSKMFTPLSAYSFMVMSLLYIPCIASIGVIFRETNSWKWTAFAVIYSLIVGWGVAVLIYQIGSLLI